MHFPNNHPLSTLQACNKRTTYLLTKIKANHLLCATSYFLPATRYPLFPTCYTLPAIRYPPAAIRHPPSPAISENGKN